MGKPPREVSGFVALPLTIQSLARSVPTATHYLYLRPHDPKVADEDAPRSLFLVNIPVIATEVHLKYLFATQLGAGRVERVHFSEDAPGRASVAVGKTTKGKKRKRATAEEAEAGLDAYSLPKVSDGQVHTSGATAIVVFLDRPSMELTLKAARKAAKAERTIIWGEGIDNKLPKVGLDKYEEFNQLRYPSRRELLRSVDDYMTAYAEMEEARSKESARKRQVPDEDGFVTVTRGSKGGLRKEEAQEIGLKEKEKNKEGLANFYRFQMREKRKERQEEMLRYFENDKQKVEEMRKRRRQEG